MEKFYRQCRLSRENSFQIAWIEEKGAIEGNFIKLKDCNDEIWHVDSVGNRVNAEYVQELSSDYRTQRRASDI